MRVLAYGVLAVASLFAALPAANAQEPVAVPQFRNPLPSAVKPATGVRVIRFLTSSDYPPFQFIGPDGAPAGFHADLARAICTELAVSCTLQALKWEEIVPALEGRRVDALIAAIRPTATSRGKLDFTKPYFRLPARFITAAGDAKSTISPRTLEKKRIAVVDGSAHAAFLRAFFPAADIAPLPDLAAALVELREGRAFAVFADGAALSLWLRNEAADCCAFAGGPYLETRFFGEGLSIAVRAEDAAMRDLLDYALDELEERGLIGDLYLKWFPLGIY